MSTTRRAARTPWLRAEETHHAGPSHGKSARQSKLFQPNCKAHQHSESAQHRTTKCSKRVHKPRASPWKKLAVGCSFFLWPSYRCMVSSAKAWYVVNRSRVEEGCQKNMLSTCIDIVSIMIWNLMFNCSCHTDWFIKPVGSKMALWKPNVERHVLPMSVVRTHPLFSSFSSCMLVLLVQTHHLWSVVSRYFKAGAHHECCDLRMLQIDVNR